MLQVIINGLVAGSIYVLFAAGLAIVLGILDIPNFAHGQTFMIGAFSTFYLVSYFGLHFIVATLVSMVLIAIFGVVMEKVAFKPLRGTPHVTLLISAIALMIFLENLAALLWGNYNRTIPTLYAKQTVSLLGMTVSVQRILVLATAVLLIIALQLFIKKTKLGMAIRAMGQSTEVTQLMGVSVDKLTSFIFALSSALAAVAGSLLGSLFTVNPYMGLEPLLKGVVILVLGGMGSIIGAIVGGLGLGLVESFTAQYLSSAFKNSIAFLILIIILVIKPTGIFGSKGGDQH